MSEMPEPIRKLSHFPTPITISGQLFKTKELQNWLSPMYLQNPAPLLRAPLEDKTPAPGKRSDPVKRPATPLEYLLESLSG